MQQHLRGLRQKVLTYQLFLQAKGISRSSSSSSMLSVLAS
jgi:hypothetical protein